MVGIFILQDHDFSLRKYLILLPFRTGYGLPDWLHPMLVAEFTVTLFMTIIITVVLSVALILLKRYIQNNNYTQNSEVNKYVIALHLFTNVLAYTGIGMLIENFMWISNPTRSCVEILYDAVRSYKIFKALLVLLFLSQLSEYYICNRYADQGAKIQVISE
jgi:hypothetical protein